MRVKNDIGIGSISEKGKTLIYDAKGEEKLSLKAKVSVSLTSRDLGFLIRMRCLPQARD